MQTLPTPATSQELAVDSGIFEKYLENLDLPTDNIIASTDQRKILSENIPGFIKSLPPEVKQNARYLSKFIGAVAIGLFDAALNYIWNEVVLALRLKAVTYGLDLFFDAAVGATKRDNFQTEEDLHYLKDSQLIDTCSKLELIPQITTKKIKNILDMRNEVAASHPNVAEINAYELMGWLSTCIKDIIKDSRSESAIKIRAFTDQLKNYNAEIDPITQQRLLDELSKISSPHIHNLLFRLFKWYTSSENQILNRNIAKIIKPIWSSSCDSVKYKIGELLDSFRTDLKDGELHRGKEFLDLVDGHNFETLPARHSILNNLSDKLRNAHFSYDNYHVEPVHIREILKFCKNSSDIPDSIQYKLIQTILFCRLGRGYVKYNQGIGDTAKSLYNSFFMLLNENHIIITLQCIWNSEILDELDRYEQCRQHLKDVLEILKNNTINEKTIEILSYIYDKINHLKYLSNDSTFIALTNNWSYSWQNSIQI